MKAYVLLITEGGKESEVTQAMSGVKEITALHTVYGIHDIVVEVEVETMDKLKEIVFNNIRRLDHVKNTITLITYGEAIKKD